MEERASVIFDSDRLVSLILRFAAPTILSLLINSFYNIVDQIFIGYGVGIAGNAATNIVYPVTTFTIAISALIGDGASTYFSLRLGEGKKKDAASCAWTAFLLSFGASVSIFVLGQIAIEPLLHFLAAPDSTFLFAKQYLRITLLGTPFLVITTVLSGLIRADGSPRYAMFCMLPGCFLNVLLDAVFVLGFHWGMAGAAWATVLGQGLNFAAAVCYIPHFQTISLSRGWSKVPTKTSAQMDSLENAYCFRWKIAQEFLYMGIAGFINQFSGTVYTVVINHYLKTYGAASIYGADITIAAYGVVMKVNQIVMSFLNGIAVGMQPIIGYHYGKRNFKKVKHCLKIAVITATLCGATAFLAFQFFPEMIMRIFGQTEALYLEFGVKCLRIFLLTVPLYGFSVVATGLFQTIGKPVHATFMALSRQILYLIPLIMILTPVWGIMGLLCSAPISDTIAFFTCLALYLREIHRLEKNPLKV